MSTVEDDGLNAKKLRLAQEQVRIHWLPINCSLEMRGFMTPEEQQACQQQGQGTNCFTIDLDPSARETI